MNKKNMFCNPIKTHAISILSLLVSFAVFMSVFNKTVFSTVSIACVYVSVLFLVLFIPRLAINKCDVLVLCLFYAIPFLWVVVSAVHCFAIGSRFIVFFPSAMGRMVNCLLYLCMYLVARAFWQQGIVSTVSLLQAYCWGCVVLLVCDPTFLLEADVYRKLYQSENVQKQKQKYLFLYMLNNQCDFDIQKVYDFAAERKLQVVYVTGNGVLDKRKKYFATIPQWLSFVDNAEYVVTNSFHCCVFSSLFGKKFGVVKLKGKYAGMNTRMESLFNQLEIASRWLQEDFSVLDKEYKPNPVKISQGFLELLNATH